MTASANPSMRRPISASTGLISKLILLCLLHVPRVFAQSQSDAQQQINHEAFLDACQKSLACSSHLNRADQLYEQASYGAALDEYQAAYILQPYPLILYNIARIHHKLSHLSDAMVYYQRYLDTGHSARAERARQLHSDAKQELSAESQMAEPPPAPLLVEPPASLSPPPPPAAARIKKPIYKKWWFFTILGVAVAGAATAMGVGIYAAGPDVSGRPARTASFGK